MSVFDNGMPLTQCDLIDDGHLVNLRASRATSQRFELPTAYLADNLILEDAAGHGDFEDLIARTADAVLITCLWYIREVDPQNLLLTGLTRDGVYRAMRDGQIVAGLPNFRFNVSVTDLLAGSECDFLSSPCLPREWADWFHAHCNARTAHRRLQSQQCQRRAVTSWADLVSVALRAPIWRCSLRMIVAGCADRPRVGVRHHDRDVRCRNTACRRPAPSATSQWR